MATFHDDDEEGEKAGAPRADLDPNPGSPATDQRTDFQRRTTRLRIATFCAAGALVLVAAYLSSGGPGTAARKRQTPKPSQQFQVVPSVPLPPAPAVKAELAVEPRALAFGTVEVGEPKRVRTVRVTAIGGTFDISTATIPYGAETGLAVDSENCQTRTLKPSETCTVAVTFAPSGPVEAETTLQVAGNAYSAHGTAPFEQSVDLSGRAVPPAPKAVAAPVPAPAPTAAPALAAAPAFDQAAADASDARQRFLESRRRPMLSMASEEGSADAAASRDENTPQRPMDLDWKGISSPTLSTYPVDMTRLLTMDKPIPAVVKVTIDTRNASRAVATVERDMYGGDGRTVVLERGSTLIGTVASVADSSQEKVAIQWLRIQRPDGVAFKISATSGDAMGRSGVLAHIDNRWADRFGNAALATVVEAVTVGLANGNQTSTNSGGSTVNGTTVGGTTATSLDGRALATQSLESGLQPLLSEFTKEGLQIPVIRIVPAGTRITVWPTSDLELRPVETKQNLKATRPNRASARAAQDPGFLGGDGKNPYAQPAVAGAGAQAAPNPQDAYVADPAQSVAAATDALGPSAADTLRQRQAAQAAQGPSAQPGQPGYQSTGVLPSSLPAIR